MHGINDYVAKPISESDLYRKLFKWVVAKTEN